MADPANILLVEDDKGSSVTLTALLKPESTEGGGRVSALKRQEGAPVLLG